MKTYRLLKPLLAAAALITTSFAANAQTYQWANRIGGSGYDHAASTAFDAAGNVYITGEFSGTVDFDPGTGVANRTATGLHDIFIAKYDAAGNYQWASAITGTVSLTAWSEGLQIAVDTAGKVVVAGYFAGTVDFDPGPGTVSHTAVQQELFVARYDAAGNLLWVNTTGGGSVASALTLDLAGNIYVSGVISGISDFDPGPGTANLNTMAGSLFIVKYSPSGAYLWAKNMAPTTGSLSAQGMGLDKNGNIYLTGAFNGTLNFNPGPAVTNLVPVGVQDVFLAKFDPSGNLKWAENMGCTMNATIPKGLVVNPLTGSVYITGNHYTTIDLDPGPGTATFTTNGNYNLFLAAYDSLGAYQWAHSLGGASNSGPCNGSSVTLDRAGNVLLGGYYSQTVDFDPGPGVSTLTSIYPDIFIAKYTGTGSYLWAKSLPASHPQIFNPGIVDAKLAIDGHGNMYVSGTFADTVDFGMGVTGATRASAGNYDAYVAKYTSSATGVTAPVQAGPALALYPNPAPGGRTTVHYALETAGNVSVTIYDLTGRTIAQVYKGYQAAGIHTYNLTQQLLPGMYTVQLRAEEEASAARLVVTE